MSKKLYKETSRYKGPFFYGVTGLLLILTSIRLFQLLFLSNQIQTGEIIFSVLILGGLSGLLWYVTSLKMKLSITEKGIDYKLSPLHSRKKRIPWEEVESCEIVKTPILQQYQGGNITFNHEKRFSANGRNGLQIRTKDGDVYFLGSNRLQELKKTIEQVFNPED
ncbi:MAG: hypothetical protein KDC34_08490 [Saprospiraceae bacterium]|nr:hypothetical protein [Saprospiraceae bacterium]